MKKYLLSLLALVVFTISVNAQKKKAFAWNKKYMTEIGVPAEQQAKIETIKNTSNAEMKAVRADASLAEDAKKTKLAEMQKKRLASIEALLTDEQKKKAEEIRARVKAENGSQQ